MDWIDINDSQPAKGLEVLVCIDIEEINSSYRAICIGEVTGDGVLVSESPVHEYPCNYWEGSYNITHWMELPKEQKQNNK